MRVHGNDIFGLMADAHRTDLIERAEARRRVRVAGSVAGWRVSLGTALMRAGARLGGRPAEAAGYRLAASRAS